MPVPFTDAKLGSGIRIELFTFAANFHIPPGLGVMLKWRAERESNPRMPVLQTGPLITWVSALGADEGCLTLPEPGLSRVPLTTWATSAKLLGRTSGNGYGFRHSFYRMK